MKSPDQSASATALLAAAAIAVVSSVCAARPLALVGDEGEVQSVQSDVTNRERIPTVAFTTRLPSSYDDFAAVVLCGNPPKTVKVDEIPSGVTVVRCEAVCATRIKYIRAGKPLAEADDAGVSVLTDEGKIVRDMVDRNRKAILAVPGIERTLPPCEWDVVPLGPAGNLVHQRELANKPKFCRPPKRAPGLVLLDGETSAVVVASRRSRRAVALARELAWHLERMGGRKFAVEVAEAPSGSGPAVVLREVAGRPFGRSSIRREGNRLVLEGESTGLSHAVTYLLEALGCRYLWPGPDGKIIPRRSKIVCPEIALDYVPRLKVREIRVYPGAHGKALENLGIKVESFEAAYRAAEHDAPGNRDFFAWHGINDGRNLGGSYQWGHYFGNYYERFGESHPEWFGMQANGSRKQHLGDRAERPTLCLSNRGLAEQAVKDILSDFSASPGMLSHSICLPDGGYMGQCMCEACRRLDPVNAPPAVFHTCSPLWRTYPYVSMTDRVMTFNNRIAEGVTAAMPGRKLSAYIYSNYSAPPMTVKPHPALVLLTVDGSYVGKDRGKARESVAAWGAFGNELFWRPNGLAGWLINMPQSIARPMFEDLEAFKCNNVIGTDFDCFRSQWAGRGFETYMLVKAHLNPDHLDYDTIARDYCRAGFGAAADDMYGYFAALERLCDESAAAGLNANKYAEAFDVDAFEGILRRARASAAGDDAVLRRIDFVSKALVYARWEKALAAAVESKDRARISSVQRDYIAFVRDHAVENALVLHPKAVGSTYYSANMKGAFK